jgi:hypothetical protein
MTAWRLGQRARTSHGSGSMRRPYKRSRYALGLLVIAAIAVFAVASSGAFAGKQPLTIAVTPTSAGAGSTGNAFTFKVTTSAATAGQLSLVVPAGWTAPQASNSTLPGYVVIQKLTCASAGPFPTSITGSGPWTITVAYNCATNKNFSMTYGGTVAPSKVTAPTSPGFYEFTSQADFGSGFQRLASQPVVSVTAPSVHLAVSGLPSTVAAGAANSFSVSARDSKNNVVTKYVGTIHLSSNDPGATLPADYTFSAGDSGTHTFTAGATFVTTGSRTLTATDTSNGAINGSQTITVGPGAATHFVVGGLANPSTAGVAQSVTVTAKDAFNNTATGYTGTVHVTSSDGAATLPANYAFTGADAGSHSFSVTLRTLGSQDVTATDTANASISGLQTVTVQPGAATHFAVSVPASTTAGTAFSFTVTAKDSSNNTATGYGGTVHFTSSDGQATLPADSTLTNGTGTFSVTLKTAGTRAVTATDTATASITGSASTLVAPAAATHFAVTAPASATAGSAFSSTVTALDQFNNTATGYSGTVHFTSSDGQAILPADSTLTNGTGTFSVTLETAGTQTVTATDTVTASITGTTGSIAVAAASATHFAVSAPASATAGSAFSSAVTALDQFNNTVTGYSGTVHFTSTDVQAVLPADSTLTNGTGTFSVTLKTAGLQTVTATDSVTASVTGTSNTINVSASVATHLLVSGLADPSAPGQAQDVTVTAKDDFGNTADGYGGTIHFTSSDVQAVLPADTTLTNGTGTFSATLKTAGTQTVTATDTVTSSITGSQSVTVDDTLYVATTGSDSNAGSQASPLKTVKAAVTATGSLVGVLKIHVAQGTYNEGSGGVALVDGLTISGGYAPDWTQTGSTTTIVGAGQSAFADGDANVSLDHLALTPTVSGAFGASVYGLRAINNSSVTLTDVTITTPAASPGSGGTGGGAGTIGDPGDPGFNATGSSCPVTVPGGHGGSAWTLGGEGGDGNCSGGTAATAGGGGHPGSAGSVGGNGGPGGTGDIGPSGAGGAALTTLASVTWLGLAGGVGGQGDDGGGGGGGGAGPTATDCIPFIGCINFPGGGGGGGGGGGQGGFPGHGGFPGGGSFGVYLWNLSTVTLNTTTITVGHGGAGGAGVGGGPGGSGAPGASGGGGSSPGGPGGHGGNGGAGGPGGAGGGGAGGPSIGIFRGSGSTYTDGGGNTLTPGSGGPGGASPGIAGSPGLSQQVH